MDENPYKAPVDGARTFSLRMLLSMIAVFAIFLMFFARQGTPAGGRLLQWAACGSLAGLFAGSVIGHDHQDSVVDICLGLMGAVLWWIAFAGR
ncbi:MAG TPA: hypothetical protein VHC22_05740 [Pirellulales bacterium]|nr:hypothetical protein [Pirellulales bacterium]